MAELRDDRRQFDIPTSLMERLSGQKIAAKGNLVLHVTPEPDLRRRMKRVMLFCIGKSSRKASWLSLDSRRAAICSLTPRPVS
ncbi:hypothetical protein [Bradyrhizobium sp. 87]|uniref:hypothetical protein n=1 Tax=Bradyrhizobium sp. 87 TaxID=2782682 RepID=UPI001FF85674|nr:hypothetical protein [Bradyrhizobium sp. 87]